MRLNRSDAEIQAGRTYFNVCTQCGKPCDPLDVANPEGTGTADDELPDDVVDAVRKHIDAKTKEPK